MLNVGDLYGYSVEELQGRSRKKDLTDARREVVRQLWQAGFMLKEIGLVLGGRDHSTIIYLRDSYRVGPEVQVQRLRAPIFTRPAHDPEGGEADTGVAVQQMLAFGAGRLV
jgi:hypothetical protein